MTAPIISHPTADQWEWRIGQFGFGVRAFAATKRLIWSSWQTVEGIPEFNEGTAQAFSAFIDGEPPPFEVPAEVLNGLTRLLKK
jgi:hypothetical protein